MRLFFITAMWYISRIFFRIFLLGNRRTVSFSDSNLFKVVPLNPVDPLSGQIEIVINAEFEIRNSGFWTGRTERSIYGTHTRHFFAGDADKPTPSLIVPLRIFCPFKVSRLTLQGVYCIRNQCGEHVACQEYENVGPGIFNGFVCAHLNKEEE